MIDAAGGRHAGDLCLGEGSAKEPGHLADRFRLIPVRIYGDQDRLLSRDIGGCKKTDATFYVIERAETMGHLEHESSNLSEEAFARASKRLMGNAALRKQIHGACFRKSQRFRREAEIRFFRFYDTPPTHLKVKFFRGGVNNCLQIYMRAKRGTPDAFLGGISCKPL